MDWSVLNVSYDEFFETVRPTAGNPDTISLWPEKAGFRKAKVSNENSQDETASSVLPSENEANPSGATTSGADSYLPRHHPSESEDDHNLLFEKNASQNQEDDHNAGPNLQPVLQEDSTVPITQHVIPNQRANTTNNESEPAVNSVPNPPVTRSGRQVRWSTRYVESLESSIAEAQDDATEFIKAMSKEFNDHCKRGHWAMIPNSEVPHGEKILDSIWSMKRKREIKSQKIIKYKARLNVHGGQQQY